MHYESLHTLSHFLSVFSNLPHADELLWALAPVSHSSCATMKQEIINAQLTVPEVLDGLKKVNH